MIEGELITVGQGYKEARSVSCEPLEEGHISYISQYCWESVNCVGRHFAL